VWRASPARLSSAASKAASLRAKPGLRRRKPCSARSANVFNTCAVSPAIIYSTKASGDFACTFVSENIRTIMGFAPEEMLTDPKCWPDRLHPEDGPRVFEEMPPLIERGGGTLVYRFRHADGSYLWIQDTFKVVIDEHGQPMELVGAWADISERRRAEQQALEANAELQKTKRSLSQLIESSPSAIIATDKSGKRHAFQRRRRGFARVPSRKGDWPQRGRTLRRRGGDERTAARDGGARRHGLRNRQPAVGEGQ
jgi:PAS domain S-box-containing protein